MLSVILQKTNEPQVIELTKQNLSKELVPFNSELIVDQSWWRGVQRASNPFVCLVEADCLVNSGYFSSMMGLFQKNPQFTKLAMMGSATGVNDWANKIYGYKIDGEWTEPSKDKIQTKERYLQPVRSQASSAPYAVEVSYVGGAIIRRNPLLRYLKDNSPPSELVTLSRDLSLWFWDNGQRVYINPNSTYVTTENHVINPADAPKESFKNVFNIFAREGI